MERKNQRVFQVRIVKECDGSGICGCNNARFHLEKLSTGERVYSAQKRKYEGRAECEKFAATRNFVIVNTAEKRIPFHG